MAWSIEFYINVFIHLFLFYLLQSVIMAQGLSSSLVSAPVTGVLLLASTVYFYFQNKRTQDSLPPRAPGYLPVVGHLLHLLKPVSIHQLFYNWSLESGPIFTCYFGNQRWIILNSIETIRDLIVDRGTIYSSRNLPDTLVHDFMQGGNIYMCAWIRVSKVKLLY